MAPDGDFTAIGKLAVATGDDESMDLMIQHLSIHPQGEQAFKYPFSLGTIDLAELSKLANNTLGYLYAEHMSKNQLKLLESHSPQNARDFVGVHITETHDIWHVIAGCQTDMLGEIQLEAFYIAQLKMSRFWLALMTKNLLKSLLYDIEVADRYMGATTKGWMMGDIANPLLDPLTFFIFTRYDDVRVREDNVPSNHRQTKTKPDHRAKSFGVSDCFSLP